MLVLVRCGMRGWREAGTPARGGGEGGWCKAWWWGMVKLGTSGLEEVEETTHPCLRRSSTSLWKQRAPDRTTKSASVDEQAPTVLWCGRCCEASDAREGVCDHLRVQVQGAFQCNAKRLGAQWLHRT